MINSLRRRADRRADRSHEGGYVAVMTALLLVILMGLAAFAVDVGQWYVVGQQEQRAADAAALAGVTNLPEDQVKAFATAQNFSKINGFQNGVNATTVTPLIDTAATRLRVSVTRTVDNIFGPLLGVPKTTITRTAVADYAGPVPLGSPCNEYGDDPDLLPNPHKSVYCADTGQFWANVGSPQAPKSNGDAYQNQEGSNTDFDPNGYFYTVTLTKALGSLTIEVFDPAMINVGDYCEKNNLSGAKTLNASNTVVNDPATRYAEGATSKYCTGDNRFDSGGTNNVVTEFTMRSPGPNPWDPLSFPIMTGTCAAQKFNGYDGDLKNALDTTNAAYTSRPDVAANFRQWKQLCKITNAPIGTYMIQVKTNEPMTSGGVGNDAASGHNRFSLRAYAGSSSNNDEISVAGYAKMGMYGNTPNGTSKFYLAKVPSGSKGHLFNVSLFDIGDGATSGSTITVLPPSDPGSPANFSECTGVGPALGTGSLTNCQIKVDSSYNGQWETISVPISSTYTCDDTTPTGCWVRLEFYYGPGSGPADTTSWTASIEGDPVRLVE